MRLIEVALVEAWTTGCDFGCCWILTLESSDLLANPDGDDDSGSSLSSLILIRFCERTVSKSRLAKVVLKRLGLRGAVARDLVLCGVSLDFAGVLFESLNNEEVEVDAFLF